MAPAANAWEQSLTEENGIYTFEIKLNRGDDSFKPINTNGAQRGWRPIVQLLPKRLKGIKIIEGDDLKPVITDDFILIPILAKPMSVASMSCASVLNSARNIT